LPEEIIIDGLEEHAFRRWIETMLRNGRADEAVERLKKLLPECAGEGKTLPGRLLDLGPEQINLAAWDQIATSISEYSRPSSPITAIGIGISDPADEGLAPDAEGNLKPPLATSYYSDATFPFSETDRADLLEGYSTFGCEWQGDHDQIDNTLSIEGIDDLYGAIARLENEVAASNEPDGEMIRAGAIGACYLGVMVWQAARRAVIEQGLPRPMALLLVNSDAYPFFDAPVMTCDEYLDDGALQVVDHGSAAASDDSEAEEQQAASLVGMAGLGSHREKIKKMALALEGDEAHNPLGMADDLVAQAAFNPESIDITRFMPDAAEFANEAPEMPQTADAAPAEFADDPEFPVDRPDNDAHELAQRSEPIESFEPAEPSKRLQPFEPAKPIEFSPQSEFAQPSEPAQDIEPGQGTGPAQPLETEQDPAGIDGDALPKHVGNDDLFVPDPAEELGSDGYGGADRWQPPDWATDEHAGAFSPAPEEPVQAEPNQFVPVEEEQATDVPFAEPASERFAPCQPASHSIRASIRTSPEEVRPDSGGASLIARFIQWVTNLLARR